MGQRSTVLPPTFWYAEGSLPSKDHFADIDSHLTELGASRRLDAICGLPDSETGDQRLDVAWTTDDGAKITGRLFVGEDRYSEDYFTKKKSPGGAWMLLVEADRPWQQRWESPARLLLPKKIRPVAELNHRVLMPFVPNTSPGWVMRYDRGWERMITSYRREPWMTLVLTCGSQNTVIGVADSVSHRPPVMVNMMPPSAYGRVYQVIVNPDEVGTINEALRKMKLPTIPALGAVVIADASRPSADSIAVPGQDLMKGFDELRRVVAQRLQQPVTVAADHVLRDRYQEHRNMPPLSYAQALLRPYNASGESGSELDTLRAQLKAERQARAEEKAVAEKNRQLLEEQVTAVAELRSRLSGDRLAKLAALAIADRDRARADAEAADSLLDEQARRISYLQAELLKAGRSYDEEPAEEEFPSSWKELLDRSGAQLPFVEITGHVMETVRALRGQPAEPSWIQRTWDVLRMLNGYGEARQKHGGDMPGLHHYLKSPYATVAISWARVAMNEHEGIATNQRMFDARVFPVPSWVSEDGLAYMESHIRIGAGTGPAPRLHFLDDTGRSDGHQGCVYVGYIGKHLPTPSTN